MISKSHLYKYDNTYSKNHLEKSERRLDRKLCIYVRTKIGAEGSTIYKPQWFV